MILLIEIEPKQFDAIREKEWVAWGVGMVFAIVATIIYVPIPRRSGNLNNNIILRYRQEMK